jgi:hypothetical protein
LDTSKSRFRDMPERSMRYNHILLWFSSLHVRLLLHFDSDHVGQFRMGSKIGLVFPLQHYSNSLVFNFSWHVACRGLAVGTQDSLALHVFFLEHDRSIFSK